MRRAITPRVERWCQPGAPGSAVGTRPSDGFRPDSAVADDGMRIDPPPSDPVASGTIPDASAADVPPDEPPGVRSRSHGLRVMPNVGLSVWGFRPNSGVLVLPTTIAPAAFRRDTSTESRIDGASSRVRRRTARRDEPDRVFQILHADRDPGERADVLAGRDSTVDVVGGRERAVGVDRDEGVHARVQLVDPRERVLDELARRDAPAVTSATRSGSDVVRKSMGGSSSRGADYGQVCRYDSPPRYVSHSSRLRFRPASVHAARAARGGLRSHSRTTPRPAE